MTIRAVVLIAVAGIAFGSPAWAQQAGPATETLKFRQWDIGGSLGIVGAGPIDSQAVLAWNIDAGRYFTPHLKAEAGLLLTPTALFSNRDFGGGYNPMGTNTYIDRTMRSPSVSGAFTYQFRENEFAHPYASAGIRITAIEELTSVIRPHSYSTTSRRFTEARPFVAAGCKSYFNERAYVRSDILMAFGKQGATHGTLRLGFGFDF